MLCIRNIKENKEYKKFNDIKKVSSVEKIFLYQAKGANVVAICN